MKTEVSSEVSPSIPDRRRHARYRFSAPITVHSKNGSSAIRGMSLEISESGMSALISDELMVGDTVELDPVIGSRVSALVRRHHGKIYGFEFLNLTKAQIRAIAKECKMLPIYQSHTLDI
jgi:hypothetical protein